MPRLHTLATVLVLALSLGASAVAPAAAEGVDWLPLGDEATVETMTRTDKPVLLFFTADWCVPCHKMKRTIFADPVKAAAIERWYLPVEVEDVSYRVGHNPPAVERALEGYRIHSIPTLVVARPDGTELAREVGWPGVEPLWAWLEEHGASKAAAARSTTRRTAAP